MTYFGDLTGRQLYPIYEALVSDWETYRIDNVTFAVAMTNLRRFGFR